MLESACRTDGWTEIEIMVSGLSEVTLPKDKYRSAALGLWEGLSHFALLCSIVIVLKSSTWKCDGERESGTYVRYCTYALFDSMVIVLKSSTWKCDGER